MLRYRLAVQRLIKGVAHSMGLEIRFAYQNAPITASGIYSRWIAPDEARCIFDVGANIGATAMAFAESYPSAKVHSFEPFSGAFQKLTQMAARYPGRIIAHQLGCGDVEGEIEVATSDSTSQLNQLTRAPNGHLPAEAPQPGSRVERVRIARLDKFCAENEIQSIDILKTDTEGYDVKVLTGAKLLLSDGRVRCVVTEVGFLDDSQHTSFSQVYALLHDLGFELAGIYEVSYHRNLACDFANAVFVHRRWLKPR